jgi:hypothetical protein
MTRFTGGHVNVTPLRITTTSSLEEIRNALRARRYKGRDGGPGWGAIGDDPSFVGQPTAERPSIGRPVFLPGRDDIPVRLAARFYYDETDRKRLRFAAENSLDYLILRASDFLMSRYDDNSYLALAGVSPGTAEAAKLTSELFDTLSELAPTSVEIDQSALHLEDSDIFRWLLYRWKGDTKLGSLELTEFDAVDSSEMAGKRRSSLTGGAEFDRPELLALLSGAGTNFGPVKVALWVPALKMTTEISLRLNGTFTLIQRGSGYQAELDESTEDHVRRMVEDTAYRVIPALKQAYKADLVWPTTRTSFTNDARHDLLGSLAASLGLDPCPVCDKPA